MLEDITVNKTDLIPKGTQCLRLIDNDTGNTNAVC